MYAVIRISKDDDSFISVVTVGDSRELLRDIASEMNSNPREIYEYVVSKVTGR